MHTMRETGMSYREIGDRYGISRQRVQQIIKKTPGNYRYSPVLKSYPTLQKYMYEHGMNLNDLADSLGISRLRFKRCLSPGNKIQFTILEQDKIRSTIGFEPNQITQYEP